MRQNDLFYKIIHNTLGTFDRRQSFSPGMFEPLKPLLGELGYDNVAVYITDDFPERMHVASHFGERGLFPDYVAMNDGKSLMDALGEAVRDVPGVMTGRLYNHGRELGALAATSPAAGSRETREAFGILVRSLSLMAYVERIRTNSRRERQERDIFFAQSLTSRLLVREAPKVRGLRLGFEHVRSLEAGGDFFDFIPKANGGLVGYVGCCNGKGLRTVMEVCGIMRRVNRSLIGADSLADVLKDVNGYLVRDKRRAHQASLCLFDIDVRNRTLRLTKAGGVGTVLFDEKGNRHNIVNHAGMFLGMIAAPKIIEETYAFAPGAAFFAVTEGIASDDNAFKTAPHPQWFHRNLADTVKEKPKVPLANAVFQKYADRPFDSLLAISVEARKGAGKWC